MSPAEHSSGRSMATVSPHAISRCLSTCIYKAGSTSNGSYLRLLSIILDKVEEAFHKMERDEVLWAVVVF